MSVPKACIFLTLFVLLHLVDAFSEYGYQTQWASSEMIYWQHIKFFCLGFWMIKQIGRFLIFWHMFQGDNIILIGSFNVFIYRYDKRSKPPQQQIHVNISVLLLSLSSPSESSLVGFMFYNLTNRPKQNNGLLQTNYFQFSVILTHFKGQTEQMRVLKSYFLPFVDLWNWVSYASEVDWL